jgi:CO/xanthine dehydrogenase Mo-binding subunit
MEYTHIGKPYKNVDSWKKVVGAAEYTADIKLPEMLYGKILRSKYPHARILNVDTSRAKKLIGVKAVVTGKDVPQCLFGTVIKDKPALAFEKVRYLGDEVAGVVAVDRDTAEEALDLIDVEYEELPAIFDPLEAMKPDAILIHEKINEYECVPIVFIEKNTNIHGRFKLRKGDVDRAFKDADLVVEDTFSVQPIQHCQIEPHGVVAHYDQLGNVTIWASTQSPYTTRDAIAAGLGIPSHKVRVIVPYIGGGFGGKYFLKAEAPCVMLSYAVRKPVKIILTREEVFSASSVRQPLVATLKTGVKKNGEIIARQSRLVWNSGAYCDIGPIIARNAALSSAGPYNIPNVRVDSYTVYTNNPISGSFRGLGMMQVTFAVESHMDVVAEQLGMDPVEFRLKNIVTEGSLSATGQVLHAVGVKECLEKAAKEGGWGQKKKRKYTGMGIACVHKNTATPSSSTAFVKVNHDATAEVITSAVDLGQGSNTILSQIVAEELGLTPDRVSISPPDTRVTPFDQATISSRLTFHMGNAVKRAAEDARREILKIASDLLDVSTEELMLKDAKVFSKKDPKKEIHLSKLPMGSRYAKEVGHPVLGKGYFCTAREGAVLDPETGQGANASVFWMYGAQCVEVEVDPETGEVKVKRVVAAHDVGKIMNPLLLEGQCQGSIMMGLGAALFEECVWENGKTINPSFVDYKIANATGIPEMVSSFVEAPHREGPYGAKGIGEPLTACCPAAIANAVYDAVGVRIKDLPITREKILWALKEKANLEKKGKR